MRLLILAALLASTHSAASTVAEMVATGIQGKLQNKEAFAATSSDTHGHYLLALTARYKNQPHYRRMAQKLYSKLQKEAIHKNGCIGWGLRARWDAFADGTTNPKNTVYIYTSSVVTASLLKAEQAGLLQLDDEFLQSVACTFTSARMQRGFPDYSDSRFDQGRSNIPVSAQYAEVLGMLGERLHDTEMRAESEAIFKRLAGKQLPDGGMPYYINKSKVLPLYHAMAINSFAYCQHSLGLDECKKAVEKGSYYAIKYLVNDDGLLAEDNSTSWSHGEMMVLLRNACYAHGNPYCNNLKAEAKSVLQKLEKKTEKVQQIAPIYDNTRTHSWTAYGLAVSWPLLKAETWATTRKTPS